VTVLSLLDRAAVTVTEPTLMLSLMIQTGNQLWYSECHDMGKCPGGRGGRQQAGALSCTYYMAVTALRHINEVTLRRARLILGWVILGSVRGYTILVFNQPSRPTQPGHPSVDRLFFFLFFLSLMRWHVPPSRTSADACLAGWPNAYPQWWDKCSVARHHQACLTVCVKCKCSATSLFSHMDSASLLAYSVVRAHPREKERCV